MSDRLRVLDALREAGPRGLHSHEIRRRGLSGHPSERAAELEREGCSIRREREYVDGRNGVRFYLVSEPPRADAGSGSSQVAGSAGLLAAVPAPDEGGTGTAVAAPPSDATAASGESPRPSQETPGETSPALFELPAERPLSAFTDAEAA